VSQHIIATTCIESVLTDCVCVSRETDTIAGLLKLAQRFKVLVAGQIFW